MMMDAFLKGLEMLLHPAIWYYIVAGTVIGLVFGSIPGLSSIVAMSLLLPFVFLMKPEAAFPLFLAICMNSSTGGSICAVLLNVPGTSTNVATLIDGFPMTQKGEGARALGAALTASGMGGLISIVFALIMFPVVMPLVFSLRSADMVFLILMGISCVAVLSKGSMLKGLISGGVGLILAFVGLQAVTGVPRFNFGSTYLIEGIPRMPLFLGLFALPEMIAVVAEGGKLVRRSEVVLSVRGVLEGVKDVFRHWGLWLQSSFIGYIIGVIPGVGGATAIFVAYGYAKQFSKHPERYGTGIVEGVIAPEAANNAKDGGALLTTLAMGIPGSNEMVLFLGAMMVLGIRPGPEMVTVRLPMSLNLMQVTLASALIGGFICLLVAPYLAKVASTPARFLVPFVTVVIFIGAFSAEGRFIDLVTLIVFGLLGLAMRHFGYNRPALILGVILGELFEKYLFIAYETDGSLFFMRPISLGIIFINVILIAIEPIRNTLLPGYRKGIKKATA
ncbi:MAG: tripartite tricarboxylate transporter permease [Thermodesulfobacteriota bacterium]